VPARIASERCDTLWCSSPCPVAEQLYAREMPFNFGPLELLFVLVILLAIGFFLRAVLK
jgi:hypothetical protein